MAASTTQHRHLLALNQALDYVSNIVEDSDRWERVKIVEGIDISVKKADTTTPASLPTFRGDGIIPSATVQEVASVLRGFSSRRLWDPRFEKGRLLETISDTANLVLSSQLGNLIVRSRDFLTVNQYRLSNDAESAILVSTSVEDTVAPPDGYWGLYVRGEAKAVGWILEQQGENVKATYVVEVDVKGQIPQSLINIIQVQAPLCIQSVAKTLDTYGCNPHIVRGLSTYSPSRRLRILKEWMEPEGSLLTLTVSLPPGKSNFSIAFPSASSSGCQNKFATTGASIQTTKREANIDIQVTKITSPNRLRKACSTRTSALLQLHCFNSARQYTELSLTVRPFSTSTSVAQRISAALRITPSTSSFPQPSSQYEVDDERLDDELSSPVDSNVSDDSTLVGSTADKNPIRESSKVPKWLESAMDNFDNRWEKMIDYSATTLVKSYFTVSKFLSKVATKPTPPLQKPSLRGKSRFNQLDNDRVFNHILETVLDGFSGK